MYTIGVDIGTTGTKVVLFDVSDGIVAQETAAVALHSARPGFSEARPQDWLSNLSVLIPQVLQSGGVNPASVKAIAVTGMVPAVVITGPDHQPLRAAILQNDARATEQIETLRAAYENVDVLSATGSDLTQQSVAPTLMWLREHEREVWQHTHYVMGSYDWVLVALGATPHVEENWALESGLFNLAGDLFEPAFDLTGMDPRIVPPVRRPGEVVGSLSAAGARLTGLPWGTTLVVGGADHVLSAFAAGVEADGQVLVKLGGAGDVLAASSRAIVDPRLYLDAHPVDGLWLPNGCMATSGSLIRWFQSIVGGADLIALDQEAESRPPASLLALPYFLGEKSPLHDPDLRGSFLGLHLGHTRADLYRAVLEGIAFGFRHHFDVFRSVGLRIDTVFVTNGGSKSVLWKQIHADVLGVSLIPVVGHPGASLGAALLAAVGAGLVPSSAGPQRYITLGDAIDPDTARIQRYTEAYETWREAGEALVNTSHRLARRADS